MTLPSPRTLLLAFGATLLIVIPWARVEGERSYCEGLRSAHRDAQIASKPEGAAIDFCTVVDFGMTDAIRWSTIGGFVLLVAAAWSYGRDRRDPDHAIQ